MTVDVLVYNPKTFRNEVYKNGITKSDAKKLMKELRQKGFKPQLVTCKGTKETADIVIPENDDFQE
jgi:hypothetical protein